MYPFLKLPKPTPNNPKKGRPFPPPQLTTPGLGNAYFANKIQNKLSNLEVTFENQSQIVQLTEEGLSPERTLVIETYGKFDDLVLKDNAIPGFRPYFGYEGEKQAATDEVFATNLNGDPDGKAVPNFYYFSAVNKSALDELIRHWGAIKKDPSASLPYGLGWLKKVFNHIKDIRYWSAKDRFTESLIENWEFRVDISNDQDEQIPFYLELWFSKSKDDRTKKERLIRKLIEKSGGLTNKICEVPEISYHAISGSLPIHCIKDLLADSSFESIDLFKWDGVMYFQPAGQCTAPVKADGEALDGFIPTPKLPSRPSPKVALFDGYPLTNHSLLLNRLSVDDPDAFSEKYAANQQVHGTGMSSLICLGDLSSQEEKPLDRPIYVRPILEPIINPISGESIEQMPEDDIPIDLVHRAVRRMFEPTDFGEPPAAPEVKVINLSIGDFGRPYIRQVSPWAKLLDWLSYKYNVLFVVSAGNYTADLVLDVKNKDFDKLSLKGREILVLKAMNNEMPHRRLLSPAEAINAITVGALHQDLHEGNLPGYLIDPFENNNLPSPVNPLSWGHSRSVKPNVLMPGGRAVYRNRTVLDNDPVVLTLVNNVLPPGQKVATTQVNLSQSSVSGTAYTVGTSNAAALATRELELLRCQHESFIKEAGFDSKYEAVILKALLSHGGQFGDEASTIQAALINGKKKLKKNELAKYLGYGQVDSSRIYSCKMNQATAVHCGEMVINDDITYKLPLPASLIGKQIHKRLIITLAWLTPINASSDTTYRGASIKFDYKSSKTRMGVDDLIYDHHMMAAGTVAHSVFEGNKIAKFIEGADLEINLECKGSVTVKDQTIPYALIVSIDAPGSETLNIYQEVKTKLEAIHEVEKVSNKSPVRV
jgi:hypothetical protein